jgi:hypothetical protein
VLAAAALGQALGEEALQDGGEAGHTGSFHASSRRPAAAAMSSGQACRYQ